MPLDLPKSLTESLSRGRLVLFAGAGETLRIADCFATRNPKIAYLWDRRVFVKVIDGEATLKAQPTNDATRSWIKNIARESDGDLWIFRFPQGMPPVSSGCSIQEIAAKR